MVKSLRKSYVHRTYIIYGPNAHIIEWLNNSEILDKYFKDANLTEGILFKALGSPSYAERVSSSKIIIESIWYSFPEFGPYPFIETLSEFEFDRIFFSEYRDHVTHQLKVFLTGLYLYFNCGTPLGTSIGLLVRSSFLWGR